MSEAIKILCTNNVPGSAILKARNRGMELIVKPFISIHPTHDALRLTDLLQNKKYDFIAITSKNAIRSLIHHNLLSQLKRQKLYVVGKKTHDFLVSRGIHSVYPVDQNANGLAEKICKEEKNHSGLFLKGSLSRKELPEKLKKEGVSLEELTVYETRSIRPEIRTELYHAVFFLSPSSAKSFFRHYKPENNTPVFCIGNSTKAEVQKHVLADRVIIPEDPSIESLVESAYTFFNHKKHAARN